MKPNRLLFFCGLNAGSVLNSRQGAMAGRALIVSLILVLLAGLAAAYYWYSEQLKPVQPADSSKTVLVVRPGMTTGSIADQLLERGLIRNRTAFLLAARQTGLDKSLQAGEYAFSRSMSTGRIIEIMARGLTVYSEFTIPEGFTVVQIATLLEEKGLARKDRFLALAKDYSPLGRDLAKPNVLYRAEGFLFPDTYQIDRGASEEQIMQIMGQEFVKRLPTEFRSKAEKLGMSVYEAIILASLIEREAQLARERPMVARVFLNRLKIDMPLQSCATIQYILGYPKEELTIADTQLPSPFNTYLHAGMPPGPVANPGQASLQAAVNPAEGDWLYFVVDGKTGGHRFSRSLAEHEEAIRQIGK